MRRPTEIACLLQGHAAREQQTSYKSPVFQCWVGNSFPFCPLTLPSPHSHTAQEFVSLSSSDTHVQNPLALYRLRAVFPKEYHQNHWVFTENSLVLRTESVFQGRGSKEPDFCFKASQVIVMTLECGKHLAWELESKGVYSSGCPLTFPVLFPASFSPFCQADFPRDCKSRQQAMEGSYFWCGLRKWTTIVCMTKKGGGRVCSGLGSLRVHVFTLRWIWVSWSGLWNEPKSSHSHWNSDFLRGKLPPFYWPKFSGFLCTPSARIT